MEGRYVLGGVFMDLSKAFDCIPLSKAFDCIPHDLLIAKLKAYGDYDGFDDYLVHCLYSYLDNRK